jgi:glutamate formiminotransferase/formiminotetrahydrofolate cyclodeaminase
MVANLSSHKRGWDARWREFSDWADQGKRLHAELLWLVDEDTRAFNRVMDAFGLPRGSETEKAEQQRAIQAATRYAAEVPLRVMRTTVAAFDLIAAMAESGNPSSVSDAGVGALCVRAAVMGAHLNVKINCASLTDQAAVAELEQQAAELERQAIERERAILAVVEAKMQR